eukprot:CAMPEP_0202480156 /NCGR_PEP_ID=MMETSP1361-20130828/258_1 /ASSEMBLY_ACC=CAM_ASM_000849 /TAXON_ID=210615 /ORGANISM="Staurosira complex sp., Strain CCMP2646" /LENGTH=33 /DNA_ID= /DNA_START= /DNA_END= /DNA_ORIENTATION=
MAERDLKAAMLDASTGSGGNHSIITFDMLEQIT